MLKTLFKISGAIHVFLYRLTNGKIGGSMRGFNVLLLTTTGRKTGKKRTVPLGAIPDQDGYIIVGSNAGLDSHPGWYHNLKNNPQVEVQIGSTKKLINAEILSGERRAAAWQTVITSAPPYGDYEKRTKREIPLVFLKFS